MSYFTCMSTSSTVRFASAASQVRVTLINNETYSAKVVGYDVDKDVAVLQLIVPPDKLKVRFGV